MKNFNEQLKDILDELKDKLIKNEISKSDVVYNIQNISNFVANKIQNDNDDENLSDKEQIEYLKEKLLHAGSILEGAFEKELKTVCKIISGPDEKGQYRVSSNSDSHIICFLDPSENSKIKHEDIEEGYEVVVCKNIIEEVLPKELIVPIEPTEFNKVQWEDIRGLKSQLERIKDLIKGPLLHKEIYEAYKLKPSKGILLYGPPGTGKTMIAKAIASEILKDTNIIREESFVYLKGGELLSKYIGEAENNIKKIFDKCRNYTKETGNRSIIFLDEAEAILPTRGSRKSSDVETTVVPTFLAEMDGFSPNSPFVILATNHPDSLDPAIIRPGRIDLKLEINIPNKEDSLDILNFYYSKTLCKDSVSSLSEKTLEYIYNSHLEAQVSGAFLKNIVDEVIQISIKRVISQQLNSRNYGILLEDVDYNFNVNYDIKK